MNWREQAVCASVDSEPWFPEQVTPYDEAFRLCVSCPVQRECLKFSFDNREEFGIWGGVGPSLRLELLPKYVRRGMKDRVTMLNMLMGRVITALWDEVEANRVAALGRQRERTAVLRRSRRERLGAGRAA